MTMLDARLLYLEAMSIPGFDLGAAATMSDTDLYAAYNGVGPERWPPDVRNKIDTKTSLFAPAVLVHDCDFQVADGSNEKLAFATRRFRCNTKAILDYHYPVWTLRQLSREYRIERAKAIATKTALDIGVSEIFCIQAWREASAKNVI